MAVKNLFGGSDFSTFIDSESTFFCVDCCGSFLLEEIKS